MNYFYEKKHKTIKYDELLLIIIVNIYKKGNIICQTI